MDKRNNIKAIILSPIMGMISLIILFFINELIDKIYFKELDGIQISDGIIYYLLFPIIFFSAVVFQIFILEPFYRVFKRKKELNRKLMLRTSIFLTSSFSLIFSLIFGRIRFGFSDYLIALMIGLVVMISYFIPNIVTYYLIYVKGFENK